MRLPPIPPVLQFCHMAQEFARFLHYQILRLSIWRWQGIYAVMSSRTMVSYNLDKERSANPINGRIILSYSFDGHYLYVCFPHLLRCILKPRKAFYLSVYHGGIRVLCIYPSVGQHKRMVYGMFVHSLLFHVCVCEFLFQRDRWKGPPQKTLTGRQDIWSRVLLSPSYVSD
jgi:hypothetical protein